MFEVIFFIFFFRTKGSKMKKKTKEEAIEEYPVVYPDVWLSPFAGWLGAASPIWSNRWKI